MQVSSVSLNDVQVNCKSRLDNKTLKAISKEFENTKVENASLDSLLNCLDRKGSRTSRISIGELFRIPIRKGQKVFQHYCREITITNPLFGQAEYKMRTTPKATAEPLSKTVKNLIETNAVDKMENSLFVNLLDRLKIKEPNTPAVSFLRELLPSFKQSGCSDNALHMMINSASEADKNCLNEVLASIDKKDVINTAIINDQKNYLGSKKEQIIRKYS